jgi:hypothetical protein
MAGPIVIRDVSSALVLAFLAALPPLQAQAPQVPAPAHLLVPGCEAVLPLDAGQAFAGPRFLVWNDRVALFEQAGPAQPGVKWRLASTERLPAAPPAAGLDRARVKWRDGALWMKAGNRVFQRDAASGQWFLMADPGLAFRDFDLDLKGRILLVATADPRTGRYRALLEAVGADRRSTEVLFEYPDRDFPRWFDQISPVAAATLLTGFESVQIQEFIVLYNPLARRVFIYQALDGTLREAGLGLPTRGVRDLAAPGAAPDDLCWQVLPKSDSEAWVVVPAPAPATGLRAITLDLVEARGDDPVPLEGRLPLGFDPQGRLAELDEALGKFRRNADAAFSAPAGPAPAAGVRRGSPPG